MSDRSPRRAFGIEQQLDAIASQQEVIRQQAIEEGLAQAQERIEAAQAEAREQIQAETAAMAAELARSLEALEQLRRELIDEARAAIPRLALTAARRMLRERIDADDPVALRAFEEIRDQIELPETFTVRVHPDDRSALEQLDAALTLESDERIARGGCIVESDRGRIDATIEAVESSIDDALGAES